MDTNCPLVIWPFISRLRQGTLMTWAGASRALRPSDSKKDSVAALSLCQKWAEHLHPFPVSQWPGFAIPHRADHWLTLSSVLLAYSPLQTHNKDEAHGKLKRRVWRRRE